MEKEAGHYPTEWRSCLRPWVQVLRPKTLTASFVPVCAASALAYSTGQLISWSLVFFSWLVAFFVQTGSHLINDAFDVRNGADSATRIGPIRATQMGLVTFAQTYWAGIGSLLLALLFGIPLIAQAGLPILLVLLFSILMAYLYTAGPYPFAYTGASDVLVILFYGLVAVGSVYYILLGKYDYPAFILGLQIGLLCTVILAVTNLRDKEEDRQSNKRTLAVRFGTTFGQFEVAFLSLTPFLLNIFWWREGYLGAAILPLCTLPLALKLVRNVWKSESGPSYLPFLGVSALLHLLFGILLTLSFFLQSLQIYS